MNAQLSRLQERLVAALAAQVVPGAGLRDPHTDRLTPPDHYGHTAAALALAAHDETRRPLAREALHAWLALDDRRIGHLPFNRLMLLLLAQVVADGGDLDADAAAIRAGIARCTLGARYPSNNWTLLAQTCRLLAAPADARAAESARLCALFERWTTRAGAFIDFPARPGRHFSTPIAYHHKALFLAALAAWFHDDGELARHAQRLLDWLVHCWDPAGYAGGLGRSNHALFGDGCLLAALILHGLDTDDTRSPVAALVRRLERQFRPDGLLWLTPAGAATGDASWDSYMHLSVYNAWTAALIAAARHLRRLPTPANRRAPTPWRGADAGCFHDDEAGVVYLRRPDGLNAMLTTRGQPPQSFSRDDIDLRYAGGVVAHLSDGKTPLVAPPVRVSRARLLAAPALAGWTPVLQWRGELFALTDFDRVTVEPRTAGVSVRLEGHPAALSRPAATTLVQRVITAIDWRLLGGRLGRRASLVRPRCGSVRARVHLEIGDLPPVVAIEIELDASQAADVRYLNPHGHSLGPAVVEPLPPWLTAPLPSSLGPAASRCLAPQAIVDGERRRYRFRVRFGHDNECATECDADADLRA